MIAGHHDSTDAKIDTNDMRLKRLNWFCVVVEDFERSIEVEQISLLGNEAGLVRLSCRCVRAPRPKRWH
jgi:hypothetical protein